MPDLDRPKRNKKWSIAKNEALRADINKRQSRQYSNPKRRGKGFLVWLLRFMLLICFVSALPMLALRFLDPPTSMFMQLNIANNNPVNHKWLDLEDISAYFPVAVIASEDQRFPDHFGFDFTEIQLVLEESKNGPTRGASTISQQTVKNLFLWPGRSFLRKGLEAWLTIWLELIVPKRRILELYVNIAQFGTSEFGIATASQKYFGLDAAELDARQSALIAAVLPTPSLSNPAKPSVHLLERAAIIQDQMPRIGGRRLISEL